MKKIYLLTILFVSFQTMTSAQTTHTIITNGFAYSPDSLHANVGDTVIFSSNFGIHPLQEVSSTTWAASGSTALAGGFSATSGSTFTVVMTQAGTRYYVCTNHVSSMGMKGRIFVSPRNGIETIHSLIGVAYPNPTHDILHIALTATGNTNYMITDMLGRNILQGTEHGTAQEAMSIDVSAIPEGNYMLSITSADGAISKSKIAISR